MKKSTKSPPARNRYRRYRTSIVRLVNRDNLNQFGAFLNSGLSGEFELIRLEEYAEPSSKGYWINFQAKKIYIFYGIHIEKRIYAALLQIAQRNGHTPGISFSEFECGCRAAGLDGIWERMAAYKRDPVSGWWIASTQYPIKCRKVTKPFILFRRTKTVLINTFDDANTHVFHAGIAFANLSGGRRK